MERMWLGTYTYSAACSSYMTAANGRTIHKLQGKRSEIWATTVSRQDR